MTKAITGILERLSKQRLLLWMPIFAVTLFAAILRAYSVSKPFTGDEMTAYIFFLRGGWNTIFQAWSDPYPPFLIDVANHPVNNILTYLSINSFSEVSVWSLRLPAFLFGCLTIPLTYALGFQCTRSRRAALFGALGLALANGHVQWSGISRGYSTMMFFEVALLLALLYFQRNRSISIGIAIVFSGVLMVYSQFVSLAVLASLVTAIAFFALTKKSFSDGADSRLRYIASNAMLFFLIGIGTAIIYSPQFSVSETLLSVLREGKLPKETFGQIPGFGSERVTTKHPNPTWEQVSLFVMGAGPVMGFILAGFWLVGLVLLAKRNIHAACMLGSLAFVPLLMILITQSFPRGRYLLFTLPAYVIPIGYLIDHGLLRIHRWLDGASKNRDTPLKFAAGIIGVSLIFVLNFPATLAHVQNPRPDRSGSWNLNDAEVFLQQQAKGDDLIWVFPVGPTKNAASAEGYIQPYGWFQQLGGLGKLDYLPSMGTTTRIYYIAPRQSEFEKDYLPKGFSPEPVARFGRTTVYRGELDTPNNHSIPIPGAWTIYPNNDKPQVETPQPVTIESNSTTNPFPIRLNVFQDSAEAIIYSEPFLVSPRHPVQLLLDIEAGPRYLSLTSFLFGLTYFDQGGNQIRQSFTSGWQDAQYPPGSHRNKLRLTEPVPPDAHSARLTALIDGTCQKDDYAVIHTLYLIGDW